MIFGGGGPLGATLASFVFGPADGIGIRTQLITQGLPLPREFILMFPYVLTIVAAWIGSVARRSAAGPANAFGELRDA